MALITYLPHLQALLNITTVLLLAAGYYFIRHGERHLHKRCMVSAAVVGVVFMVVYLIYHAKIGNVPFAGQGAIRPFYFTVLASHVILAAINVPLVIMTLVYAFSGNFDSHRRFARRVLPVWFYVSLSGLIVYLLAFHLYPG